MSKQTAVNWLIEQISSSKYFYNLMEEIQSKSTIAEPNGILHKAKEMERLQSVDDFTCGNFEGYKGANGFPSMLVNDYINKKYNGK
jgi:hypothetical protein